MPKFETWLQWTLMFALGLLVGRAFEAQKRIVVMTEARNELRVARGAAAACQAILADHWGREHMNIPGSEEFVDTAKLLSTNFRDREVLR